MKQQVSGFIYVYDEKDMLKLHCTHVQLARPPPPPLPFQMTFVRYIR